MKSDSEKISDIHELLLGDPTEGKLGLIHHHNRMFEDLYGVGSDGKEIESKKNTVLIRLSAVEDNQKKVMWLFGGVLAACAAIKLGIATLITKVFEK